MPEMNCQNGISNPPSTLNMDYGEHEIVHGIHNFEVFRSRKKYASVEPITSETLFFTLSSLR